MAKITWATGIDTVSGSLAKPVKKDGHSCGTYLIGTHRVAPTESPDCNRLYVRKANTYDSTNPLTADGIWARNRFKMVAAAVKTRKADPSKITTDQAAFIAQKDLANGKKTMKAYLWSVCGDEYDTQHPRD